MRRTSEQRNEVKDEEETKRQEMRERREQRNEVRDEEEKSKKEE